MEILILGGYGNAGKLISRLLLRHTSESIILAGRNLQKAGQEAGRLNKEFCTNRVNARQVDASDEKSLRSALRNINLVLVASSTLEYSRQVINEAIKANADYFDLQLSSPTKLNYLRSKEDEINTKGLCFITDGGFHPGLPAAMVRFAGKQFDELSAANVFSYINIDWKKYRFAPSTAREMADELNSYEPLAYVNGKWKKLRWSEYKKFDFGYPAGKQFTAPMMLEEMRYLPGEIHSLKDAGFYVSGFNWFVNYISLPFIMVGLRISKTLFSRSAAILFEYGLKHFSRPPFICILRLDAAGIKGGKHKKYSIEIRHSDGYFLTAVPVAACLLQYLNGSIRKPGLYFQAGIVEPVKFFEEIKRMGIDLRTEYT